MDLNYIGQLPHIQEVWLRYMPLVSSIPKFINPDNIKLFQTTHLPKLADVSEIFKMSNLKALMMTDLSLLKADDFSRLRELPNLKIAYITFKDPKENLKFFEFCQRNNWIYKQPALVR